MLLAPDWLTSEKVLGRYLSCQGGEQGLHLQGWGDQCHWAQAEKVICPASPHPQWALQGEQLDLWRKARCSLMKELSPSLLPLLLLAVQGTDSYRVWAAQWVLPFPFHGGQAGTKQSGVKWHLSPWAGSCRVTQEHVSVWASCSPVPWSRAVCEPGAVLWRMYNLQWFSLHLFRCCFCPDTTLASHDDQFHQPFIFDELWITGFATHYN